MRGKSGRQPTLKGRADERNHAHLDRHRESATPTSQVYGRGVHADHVESVGGLGAGDAISAVALGEDVLDHLRAFRCLLMASVYMGGLTF